MLALLLVSAALQTASAEARGDEGRTVIVAPDQGDEETPPMNSRVQREQPTIQASDSVAAMMLREWANCVVRTRRRDALALLATEHGSAAQAEVIERLTTSRFGWRSMCVRTRMMEVDNILLRGALAEALYRWENRRGRSAGPLEPPDPPDAVEDRSGQLVAAARCVVESDSSAVAALMEVRPDGRNSNDAVYALAPKLDECLPDGTHPEDFHPLLIRGALGEPFYLASRSLL